jgi:hypothetical protein
MSLALARVKTDNRVRSSVQTNQETNDGWSVRPRKVFTSRR